MSLTIGSREALTQPMLSSVLQKRSTIGRLGQLALNAYLCWEGARIIPSISFGPYCDGGAF